jgi:hypothetical protein
MNDTLNELTTRIEVLLPYVNNADTYTVAFTCYQSKKWNKSTRSYVEITDRMVDGGGSFGEADVLRVWLNLLELISEKATFEQNRSTGGTDDSWFWGEFEFRYTIYKNNVIVQNLVLYTKITTATGGGCVAEMDNGRPLLDGGGGLGGGTGGGETPGTGAQDPTVEGQNSFWGNLFSSLFIPSQQAVDDFIAACELWKMWGPFGIMSIISGSLLPIDPGMQINMSAERHVINLHVPMFGPITLDCRPYSRYIDIQRMLGAGAMYLYMIIALYRRSYGNAGGE